MNAKERMKIAMQGGMPDRVPVSPQICPPHAIRVAGLPFEETIVDILRHPRRYDLLVGQCAKNYGVDTVRVWIAQEPKTIKWEGKQAYEIDLSTGEYVGVVDFMGGGGVLQMESRRHKLTDKNIDAIQVSPVEELLQSETLTPAIRAVKEFGKEMFIIGVPGVFTVETLMFSEGMEMALIDLIERPDFIKRLTERKMEASIQEAIALARAGVDALYIGETFGGFMSPKQFANLCLPYFQQFVDEVRPYGPLIYLHMCGKITHLLELIVETGVDCIEPLDVVGGTPVEEVKRRIGDRIALMGGVNTVLLSRGSLEEVRNDCVRCLREAAAGGGYILAACDMLPTETSPEKVLSMLECANTLGRYS